MTVTYVPRAEWGARPPKTRDPFLVPASKRRGTVFHFNGPPMRIVDHAECWVKVLSVQRYHQVSKGWSDGAYSHLFCDHGSVFEMRGWAWDQFANGDDVVGAFDGPDREWFTAMWLGGEGETPSPLAFEAAEWLVRESRAAGAGLAVKPHSDFQRKSCPGPELTAWCREWDGRDLQVQVAGTQLKRRVDVLQIITSDGLVLLWDGRSLRSMGGRPDVHGHLNAAGVPVVHDTDGSFVAWIRATDPPAASGGQADIDAFRAALAGVKVSVSA